VTQAFYDGLAPDYHLIFEDWAASVTRQGEILTGILRAAGIDPPARVLDCACGIGTQLIGLARAGYTMTGSDLSPDAIARARRELSAAGVDGELVVADMRGADAVVGGGFAAAICCDNSLAHLLTEDDLAAALASIHRCLEPGAPIVASVRDYDAIVTRGDRGDPPRLLRDAVGRRRIVGQTWEWHGDLVDLALFVLVEDDAGWSTTVHTARSRGWQRSQLDAALASAGFAEVAWAFPAATGYYQPIVIARAA